MAAAGNTVPSLLAYIPHSDPSAARPEPAASSSPVVPLPMATIPVPLALRFFPETPPPAAWLVVPKIPLPPPLPAAAVLVAEKALELAPEVKDVSGPGHCTAPLNASLA